MGRGFTDPRLQCKKDHLLPHKFEKEANKLFRRLGRQLRDAASIQFEIQLMDVRSNKKLVIKLKVSNHTVSYG